MARIPIIKFGNVLVASVQEDLRDSDALAFQTDLSQCLERTQAQGVLIDISVIEMVDSFLGRLLNDVAASSGLFGAQTVVVGIQPAVAITLVELGLELRGVHTALNSETGLRLLRRLITRERAGGARRGG